MRGDSPMRMWRWMFSSTTIESSTRMPISSASAISEIMFRLKPKEYITMNVEISEVGIASTTITTLRHECRNSISTVAVMKRSEEHTSELQSQSNLVCRLLLEKKKKRNI